MLSKLLMPPPLLPCPCCGGKARFASKNTGSSWDFRGPHVECDTCGNQTSSKRSSYWLEYLPKVWTNTSQLLAARAWNARPGVGTAMCPKCGVGVPHTHVKSTDRSDEYEIQLTPPTEAEANANGKANEIVHSHMRCMTCGTAAFVPNEQCNAHISCADALETERTLHAAWEKRAYEAEAALAGQASKEGANGITHQQGLAIAKALRGEISHGKLAEILGIEDKHAFKLASGAFDEAGQASGRTPGEKVKQNVEALEAYVAMLPVEASDIDADIRSEILFRLQEIKAALASQVGSTPKHEDDEKS